jgi:hypothetical protein
VVDRPPGFTEPVNPASVAPTVGDPVTPGVGGDVITAESVAVALFGVLPMRTTVTVIGYDPTLAYM